MGKSGGGGSSNTTSTASIAPELQPLFAQTGTTVAGLQNQITPQFNEFFASQVQDIPGFTQGQMDINRQLRSQAFGPALNQPQQDAYNSLTSLINSPVGSSPATIAAMQAIRSPVLNDLALAGLGNSDAVGSELGNAYAPILAQEMAQRYAAIPQLHQLGTTAFSQGQQNLGAYGASEEQQRGILETRGQAELADLLRRQNLGTGFTTGILGGFPSIGGQTSTTTTKQSGGGGMGSVLCTVANEQGYLDDDTFMADCKFGESLPPAVLAGYHRWGIPLANAMRRSRALTILLVPLIRSWARTMRAKIEGQPKSETILGQIMLRWGTPFCGWLGRDAVTALNSPDKVEFREKILDVQDKMIAAIADGKAQSIDGHAPLTHYFTPIDPKYGCCNYARQIFLPKDSLVIGKIHRHQHLNFIMQGRVSVLTEHGQLTYQAPCVFVSEVGLKRTVYAHEDSIWATVHMTRFQGEEHLDEIEDEVISKTYSEIGLASSMTGLLETAK